MRLIDADAVYNKAMEDHQRGEIEDWEADSIINYLDDAPTINDAEIVVRCKDCKYFGRELENGKHDCTDFNLPYCRSDDFCSHGVRTDGENEKKPARETGQAE